MKKLLFLLGCAVLLSACKKGLETEPVTEEKNIPKYATTFKVEQFTNTTVPMSAGSGKGTTASPFAGIFTNLYFLIFDNNGKVVSRMEQQSIGTDSLFRITPTARKLLTTNFTFGTLTDSLAAGKYTLVAIGGHYRLMFNPDVKPTPGTDLFPATDLLQTGISFNSDGMSPTFVYKGDFEVGGSIFQRAIRLERIGGQLEVNLEDVIPSNAYSLMIDVSAEFTNYNLGGSLPWKGTTPFAFWGDLNILRGKTGFTASRYILNTVTPFNVNLVAFNGTGEVIARKTIGPVFIETNKKTILSGKLFSTATPTGFNATLDRTWDTSNTVVKF